MNTDRSRQLELSNIEQLQWTQVTQSTVLLSTHSL